jgi:dynein heavy chain
MEEVEAAREEAADNTRFLAPLRKPLDRFCGSDSLDALPGTFQARRVILAGIASVLQSLTVLCFPPQAVFHMLLLVWTHSKHYNTSARLVPLLRLIVEDLIAQCRKHLPGLLRGSPLAHA